MQLSVFIARTLPLLAGILGVCIYVKLARESHLPITAQGAVRSIMDASALCVFASIIFAYSVLQMDYDKIFANGYAAEQIGTAILIAVVEITLSFLTLCGLYRAGSLPPH